ncbi:MAG: 3-oxoacyl-[acyl-carrier protein] reductase [Chloroflexota bacterium]|jgi:3-oxoacyl-[acyl-carrier protein] reductase|nr:3-oxoacyl-[acyl-carrier protein] reductase [Chloroflexota bacterium]
MDLGVGGLRALIGGGSTGLGAAIATTLVAEGARVAIAARPGDRLEDRARALDAIAVGADLSTVDGPAAAVNGAVTALGGLDLLLVNSGGPPGGDFATLDEAAWTTAIDGVLLAALRLVRSALPHLGGSAAPAILIILSSSAREPIPGLTTSNVLRPGLAGLIKSLTAEIAPIRINGIAPGRIATDRIAHLDGLRAAAASRPIAQIRDEAMARIPLGRYGDPAEVGRLGAFLLSPAASYVSGAIVPIDGGMIRALP